MNILTVCGVKIDKWTALSGPLSKYLIIFHGLGEGI